MNYSHLIFDDRVVRHPVCGNPAKRHSRATKTIKDIDGVIKITYAKFYCIVCCQYFMHPKAIEPTANTWGRYTKRFINLIRKLRQGRTLTELRIELKKVTNHRISESTLHDLYHRTPGERKRK